MQKNIKKKRICPSSDHPEITILETFLSSVFMLYVSQNEFNVLKFFLIFHFCLYFAIYTFYLFTVTFTKILRDIGVIQECCMVLFLVLDHKIREDS